jgi:MazG family protein
MRLFVSGNHYPSHKKRRKQPMKKTTAIDRLLKIMEDLRHPENGCPWDKEQTFETIAPYTIEEAYEVAEAIKNNDQQSLKGELGDLLFQIVFYAQMSKENAGFDFDDIAEEISDKMVKRHPHVFGRKEIHSLEEQTIAWEEHKALERSEDADKTPAGTLDGVAIALPALLRAQKLQKRAARVGFDWPNIEPVIEKIREEIEEVTDALKFDDNKGQIAEEIGDLLFACVNLARHADIDAEKALTDGNDKFQRRFQFIELQLNESGKNFQECSLDVLEKLWNDAKSKERA